MESADQSWVAALTRYRDPAAEQERDIYADDWFRSQRKLVRTSHAFEGISDGGAAPGKSTADGPPPPPQETIPRKLHAPMNYVRKLNGRMRPPWTLGADTTDSAKTQRQRSGKRLSWLRPSTSTQHAADPTGQHSAGIPPSDSAPEVATTPSQIPNGHPLPTSASSAQLGVRHADGPSQYVNGPHEGAVRSSSQPLQGFQPSSTDAGDARIERHDAGAQAGSGAREDSGAERVTPLPVAAPALHLYEFPPWAYASAAPPAQHAGGPVPQTPMGAGTRVVTEPASVYGVATTTSPPAANVPPARPAAYTQEGAIRRQTEPESPLVSKGQAPAAAPTRTSQVLGSEPTRTSYPPAAGPNPTSRFSVPVPESQPPAPDPGPTSQPPAAAPSPGGEAPAPSPLRDLPGPAPFSTQRRSTSDTTSMLPPSSRCTSTGAYRWRTPGNTISMLRAPLRGLPPMASPPSGGLPPMPEAIPSDRTPLQTRGRMPDGRPRPVSMTAGAPPAAAVGRRPVSMAATGDAAARMRPVSFCPEALDARRSGEPMSKKEPAAYQQADEYPAHLDPAYSFLPRSVAEMRESLQAARRRTIAADASTEQVSFGVAV